MSRGKTQGTKEAPVKRTRLPGEKIPFYSDINLSTKDSPMLYAAVVRNPYPPPYTPVVEPIPMEEGYSIFTYRDVPGSNLVGTQHGTVYIFNPGTESYYGEALGLIVGPDEGEVKRIAGKMHIQRCVTEAGLSEIANVAVEDSDWMIPEPEEKKSPAKKISKEISDLLGFSNDAADFELHDENPAKDSMFLAERKLECGPCFEKSGRKKAPGISAALSECSRVIEHAWTYSMEVPEYVEPSGAICSYSESEKILTVYSPTLWPSHLRDSLCMALNLEPEQIRISKKKSLDRTSNSLWYNSIIACQVAVAAFCLKRTVKLVYTQKEQADFMDSMNPVTIVHKTGIDENGKIHAMQIEIDVDAGAYNPFAQEIIDRLVIASCGCYGAENIYVHAYAHLSSRHPSSMNLNLLDTAAFFAMENQMNEIGNAVGLNPLQVRELNIPSESSRASLENQFDLDISGVRKCLSRLSENRDFIRKFYSYRLVESLKRKRLEGGLPINDMNAPVRGIGVASAYEGDYYFGSQLYEDSDQSIEVTWENEKSVIIHSSPSSNTVRTLWRKHVASLLGVALSAVSVDSKYDDESGSRIPESVMSNISVSFELLSKCCASILKKKDGASGPVSVTKSISQKQKKNWKAQTFSGRPFHACSFGLASVEVEFNSVIYMTSIRHMDIIIDGGKILNRKAAENSVKIEARKILSSLVTSSRIPLSSISIEFLESDSPAMQIGSLLDKIIPAAYTQALAQVLGAPVDHLPLKNDSLYALLYDRNMRWKAKKIAGQMKNETDDAVDLEMKNQAVSEKVLDEEASNADKD